jgi:uncharacterized protein (DUF885 family)
MTRLKIHCLCLSSLIFLSCTQTQMKFDGKNQSEQLAHFFKWSFDKLIERSPMDMAYIGIDKRKDELDDVSLEYQKQTQALIAEHLKILQTFSRDLLPKNDQISYDLYQFYAQEKLEAWKWHDYRYTVNQMFGVQSELPSFMINIHKVKNEKDLDNYIARLNQFDGFLGDTVTQLMRSEAKGIVPPYFVFEKVILDCKNILKGQPFDKNSKNSPLLEDFLAKLNNLKLKPELSAKYKKQVNLALTNSVGSGYKRLLQFLVEQQKRASKEDGVWKLPDGDQYYKAKLKQMITQAYEPEEIHQIGLEQVARIHKEMNIIKNQVGYKGDLQSFFKYMKKDKFFYANTSKDKKAYLAQAKKYIDEMRSNLDQLFLTKPKADIIVKAVEAFREKSAGTAFYQSPAIDGTRPGTYYVNLYNMKGVPKWEAQALAYHEGIPGHHMQLSIAQELKNIPEFRKYLEFTSYVEGWGLYAEYVPKEFGFYKDPYSDFGRLSMDLMRACRLVVDSGMHYKIWTREQAVNYLNDNTPGDPEENLTEINRYIVMPGQATAYMIGKLKILELRQNAKNKLGDKFDIRKFHDVILTSGAVTFSVMEQLVDEYINHVKKN